jgi:hypothetical protein
VCIPHGIEGSNPSLSANYYKINDIYQQHMPG